MLQACSAANPEAECSEKLSLYIYNLWQKIKLSCKPGFRGGLVQGFIVEYLSVGKESGKLFVQLHVQEIRLKTLGEAIGLSKEDWQGMQNDILAQALIDTLCCIAMVFGNFEKLMSRYGFQKDDLVQATSSGPKSEAPDSELLLQEPVYGVSRTLGPLAERVDQYKEVIKLAQSSISVFEKCRWVLTDRAKFQKLVNELISWNDGLEFLLPQVKKATATELFNFDVLSTGDFNADSNQAPVIATAQKFLILSLLISHTLTIILPARTSETVGSVKRLLRLLQSRISRQRRADWPAISLALCLLFFGVENLQVDIHLRSERASLVCKWMEETAILMLTNVFMASTGGFKTLILDWDVEENANLADSSADAVETLRGLQCMSQEYRKEISSLKDYK